MTIVDMQCLHRRFCVVCSALFVLFESIALAEIDVDIVAACCCGVDGRAGQIVSLCDNAVAIHRDGYTVPTHRVDIAKPRETAASTVAIRPAACHLSYISVQNLRIVKFFALKISRSDLKFSRGSCANRCFGFNHGFSFLCLS